MAGGASILALPQVGSEDEELEAKARSEALQRSTLISDNSQNIEQLHAPHEGKKQEKKEPLKNLKKMYLEDEEEDKVVPPTRVTGGH